MNSALAPIITGMTQISKFLLSLVFLVAGISIASADAEYTLTDLGSVPTMTHSDAQVVTNNGEVYGNYGGMSWDRRYRWTASSGLVDLQSVLGFPSDYWFENFDSYGVDQNGSFFYSREADRLVKKWNSGNGSTLVDPTLGPVTGLKVSPSGAYLTGQQWLFPNANQGFVWQQSIGAGTLVMPSGQQIRPYAVNDQGAVVGYGNTNVGFALPEAVRCVNGSQPEVIVHLGTDYASVAEFINSSGLIAGNYGYGGITRNSFIWSEQSGLTEVPYVPGAVFSVATGLTDSGLVVGVTGVNQYDRPFPFVWSAQEGSRRLSSLVDSSLAGWYLQQAYGVSPDGKIVGMGQFGGRDRAFLLTPVPEPSSLAAIGLGVLAVIRRRRSSTHRTGLKRT